MNKAVIRELIITQLQSNLDTAVQAANVAMESATHEENIPENKYDTLGLEASYLAHGQSKRVEELKQSIEHYRHLPMRDFDDGDIALTAYIHLVSDDETEKRIFIGPDAGGLQVEFDGIPFFVITPQSPIGAALMGKAVGDSVEVNVAGSVQEFEITAVC